MSFAIEYDTQPQKFLRKLDKQFSRRIIDKLEGTLPDDSVPHDAKAIVGEHGVFRLRIGDFRILYRIDHTQNKIVIAKIDKREAVYD